MGHLQLEILIRSFVRKIFRILGREVESKGESKGEFQEVPQGEARRGAKCNYDR